MKVRPISILATSVAIVCLGVGLSGCVSYGSNTHALITPVGVVGYHTFKPQGVERIRPPELRTPDRVAAAPQAQPKPEDRPDET